MKTICHRTVSYTHLDVYKRQAVYGLYAKEDIVHPDGTTGVLYKQDSLIAPVSYTHLATIRCSSDNIFDLTLNRKNERM